jgi:hypothetical protein
MAETVDEEGGRGETGFHMFVGTGNTESISGL